MYKEYIHLPVPVKNYSNTFNFQVNNEHTIIMHIEIYFKLLYLIAFDRSWHVIFSYSDLINDKIGSLYWQTALPI